jgi:glycosyltransferase involved in cell wall biosynthesis
VLRVYHGGRDPSHRARDRALAAAGVDVVTVVPTAWPEPGAQHGVIVEPGLGVVEVAVRRPGDVNRHTSAEDVGRVLRRVRPDVLDLHEEPFSSVTHQWLAAAPATLRVVGYTAQNLDKRFPPPFAAYERAALRRLAGLYPCSRQAAAVAVGKGFAGHCAVLPLGYDASVFVPASTPVVPPRLVLAGRLAAEKGVHDAVQVLAAVPQATLTLVGQGPALAAVRTQASSLGVADRVEHRPWTTPSELAQLLAAATVLLVPSRSTPRWVEQYGRVVTEAQAAGCVVAGYASGALPETGGEAASLVAEGDVAALIRAVRRLLDDPEQWQRRRALGLAQVRDRTWEAVARAQVSLYEQVVAGPPAPVPVTGRAAATRRFGPPARVPGGPARPWALPGLRAVAIPQTVRRSAAR